MIKTNKLTIIAITSFLYSLVLLISVCCAFHTFQYCESFFNNMLEEEKLKFAEKEEQKLSENNDAKTVSVSLITESEFDLSKLRAFSDFTKCEKQQILIGERIRLCNEKKTNIEPLANNSKKEHEKTPPNDLIIYINRLLILGLAIEFFLTVYVLLLKRLPFDQFHKCFDKYAFHLSDWSINTPPIFGVLANLVSFSLLLIKSDGDMQGVFNEYFFEAVTTTLIGGIFYTINLGLKVIIHPRIEEGLSP